jgi:hypothetical protein
MKSYRIVKVIDFPIFSINETKTSIVNLTLPGFTEDAVTIIKCLNLEYYGYEYYQIEHEMLIRDSGLAFGIYNGKPIELEFFGYKKRFTIQAYLKRQQAYLLLSQTSTVIKDLFKKIKHNQTLNTKFTAYKLDLNKAQEIVQDYTGVWFKAVSTRVSSSALYGSDLINEPLFQQLTNDGANLSSITIPFDGIPIQIGDNAGISSHLKVNSIENELRLVEQIKNEIIDKIEA